MKLFASPDERAQVLVVAAAVAAHAMIAGGHLREKPLCAREVVDDAFAFAKEFLARAEQEVGR